MFLGQFIVFLMEGHEVEGHVQCWLQVTYDPNETDYKQLVKVFLEHHDPTLLNRQGSDTGTQYRSGIYVHTDEQRQIAEQAIEEAAANYQVNCFWCSTAVLGNTKPRCIAVI